MTQWRRSPRSLGIALDGVRGRLAPETVLAEIQSRWVDAVGPAIAAEAQPTAERAGVLTVSCSASVWAHELDLMGPEILERLNALLHGAVMTRLRCVTAAPGDGGAPPRARPAF
jgi:predicted nucleic acid-binding Zn ribbon protein